MELEPKITEVELIRDREKNPLEPRALKAMRLYLKLIKQDRYNIKSLVECLRLVQLRGSMKGVRPQTQELIINVRIEGHPETLHGNLLPRRTENVLHLDRGRES